MKFQVICRLKNIAHSGAHIGRDITIKITSPLGIAFSAKKRVLADRVTQIGVEIGRFTTEEARFSLPLVVTVIERDLIFDDVGVIEAVIAFEDSRQTQTHTVNVSVSEQRWFFWKTTAIFTLTIEVEIESMTSGNRIPTVGNPLWTGDFNDDPEAILLARVIFGEARDERLSDSARSAVGWSVRNRVEYPNALRYGGDTYHAVILKPKQYSSFTVGDSNRAFVEDPLGSENESDMRAWRNCYDIAKKILADIDPDLTNGANHYFDNSTTSPTWAKQEYFTVKIGPFLFYALP